MLQWADGVRSWGGGLVFHPPCPTLLMTSVGPEAQSPNCYSRQHSLWLTPPLHYWCHTTRDNGHHRAEDFTFSCPLRSVITSLWRRIPVERFLWLVFGGGVKRHRLSNVVRVSELLLSQYTQTDPVAISVLVYRAKPSTCPPLHVSL